MQAVPPRRSPAKSEASCRPPILALMLNPIHANIENPDLWLAQWAGERLDDRGLKSGVTRLRLLRRLGVPEISITQRVALGYQSGAPSPEAEAIDVEVAQAHRCPKCGGQMQYDGYHRRHAGRTEYVALAACNHCGHVISF